MKAVDDMVGAVMRLWDTGLDTDQIGKVLLHPQEEIERVLHIGLEMRRRKHAESSGS